MDNPILARIKEVLVGTFGVNGEQILPGARLKDDLGLDSIDLFDLVGILEREYGAQIEVGDFKGVETFEALVQRIEALLADHPSTGEPTPRGPSARGTTG